VLSVSEIPDPAAVPTKTDENPDESKKEVKEKLEDVVEEPQNTLTKKFPEAEWSSLVEFRVCLHHLYPIACQC
jgi:hypothetical protein